MYLSLMAACEPPYSRSRALISLGSVWMTSAMLCWKSRSVGQGVWKPLAQSPEHVVEDGLTNMFDLVERDTEWSLENA